ncbi:MAG: YicC/YloC family endoribonuclease [Candidatus Dasytiphilus stammeri]
MIHSMTAFTRYEINNHWGNAVWEIRSVNQRYLETYMRLPDQFRNLEPAIRNLIRNKLTRGKIEFFLRFEPNMKIDQDKFKINKPLVKQLIKVAQWISLQNNAGIINPMDILRWPGVVLLVEDLNAEHISIELLAALNITLKNFIIVREIEGSALKKFIEQRLANISTLVSQIRIQIPNIIKWQKEKILVRLQNLKLKMEDNRLEQEMVLLAQRLDVSEELDRLDTHIMETYNILNRNEAIGRRLDFMMQELYRESNTLASKSLNSNITALTIELKVLIEQMREQIQNIE